MLPAERRLKMSRMINELGGVNTRQLAEELGISLMTVRRDLKILADQNQLEITWGGAVPVNFQAHDIPYARKKESMAQAKQAIARAALDMVPDEGFLILDAGTTTLELAKLLNGRKLTVVTHDLQIAALLSTFGDVKVHLAGGEVDPLTQACADVATVDYYRPFQADLAFLGTNVWDLHHGVSTSSRTKMRIKQQIMASAHRSVLLADSHKYANYSPWRVAGVDDFDLIITDNGLPQTEDKALEAEGVSLMLTDTK